MNLPLTKGRILEVRVTRQPPPGPPPAVDPPLATSDPHVRRDLMRVHSKKVAAGFFVLATASIAASFAYGARGGLPGVAFDWLFGLQLIRAAVAFAIVAVLVMLIVRGWGGLWPNRVLTSGFEFPVEEELERDLAEGSQYASRLRGELQALISQQRE